MGYRESDIICREPLTNVWTQCPSQVACRNNPNWASIYYTSRPAGVTFENHLMQDDTYELVAQSPNPSSRIVWNNLSECMSFQ